jgi:molybdopterin molybdotransferase
MKTFISFKEAFDLTLASVAAGKTETLPLDHLNAKILSEDIVSNVDCPSISTSRKDGYAVISADVTRASASNPISLKIVGTLAAGATTDIDISRGQAARITTGAALPESADAVISEEFCRRSEDTIFANKTAGSGRNRKKYS